MVVVKSGLLQVSARHAGPNTGFEFGRRYEYLKLLSIMNVKKCCKKIGLLCCFMFSLGKYALL